MTKQLNLLAVFGLALVLAGCTAPEPTSPSSSSPTAAAEPTSGSDYAIPDVAAECVDGTVTVVDDSSNVTIDGDCENVVIEASNSMVTVTGSVVNLSFESSITLVTAPAVEYVTFVEGANGNKVATPSVPVVDDGGEGNVVSAE
ncbi:hypothetical protein [Plantibacter sp. VKM Ac-2876]|uniref:hypothetical protein n=1 Tax=Plantibacter sp. VKM Ac-2876 TaxID=2783826 RepID=UPI00188B3E05|nr:hypothetical protein [Plantibacter sp. VKM Ac-2876]MBF4565932.1 hypothetical protein [Plantibacter sp. VKM Ac-2876]